MRERGTQGRHVHMHTLSQSFYVTLTSFFFFFFSSHGGLSLFLKWRRRTGATENRKNRQRWWHWTCLLVQDIPDKSAYLFRWYSKWAVSVRLTVLISDSTTHDKIIHHPEYWKGKKQHLHASQNREQDGPHCASASCFRFACSIYDIWYFPM